MSNSNIDVDEQWKLLIGGEWVRTDETYDIIDPNTTELVGRAPEATVGHAQAAARAAKEALPGWKETPMAERCKLLAVAAERLAEVAPNWVDLVQAETGSTINVAETMQMSGLVDRFRYYATPVDVNEGVRPIAAPATALAPAALLGGYLLLLAGGQTAAVYALRGFYPARFPAAFGFMWLEALLLLSVTMWASSRLSTLAAGVVAIGLHGLAFLGGWIEEIGHVAGNNSAEMVGVVASVVFPSEALWRRAAYELLQPLVVSVIGTPFGARVVPSDWMAVYAAVYAAFALAMAVRSFSRRDL